MARKRNGREAEKIAVLVELGARVALQEWLLQNLLAMGLLNAPDPIAELEVTQSRAAANLALFLNDRGMGAPVDRRTKELAAEFWASVRARIQIHRAGNDEAAPSPGRLQ